MNSPNHTAKTNIWGKSPTPKPTASTAPAAEAPVPNPLLTVPEPTAPAAEAPPPSRLRSPIVATDEIQLDGGLLAALDARPGDAVLVVGRDAAGVMFALAEAQECAPLVGVLTSAELPGLSIPDVPFTLHVADFLGLRLRRAEFDAVLVRPPHPGDLDLAYVAHALPFVKAGGTLVALMSSQRGRAGYLDLIGHHDYSTVLTPDGRVILILRP